jgi:hypothetical protein
MILVIIVPAARDAHIFWIAYIYDIRAIEMFTYLLGVECANVINGLCEMRAIVYDKKIDAFHAQCYPAA